MSTKQAKRFKCFRRFANWYKRRIYPLFLKEFTKLNVYGNHISGITLLQSLTNLSDLNPNNNNIVDLRRLGSMKNLISRVLGSNELSDITLLESLTNLTSLTLNSRGISDITPLQSLTNLIELHLEYNNIADITTLQSLTNLIELELEYNNIADLTPLQSLTNLTHLNLSNNKISDLTPLQSLTNLTYLNLRNNKISDLTPLQSLTNLTDLDLQYNQTSDITPLQFLTNLTDLYLIINQISDITPLQSLTNLTYLNLIINQISDITPLQSLNNLTKRYIKIKINFTPEQNALIVASRQKWANLANSTEPISRPEATDAIKAVYEILGLKASEITFCSSPNQGVAKIEEMLERLDETYIQNFHNANTEQEIAQIQTLERSNETDFIERFDKHVEDALTPFLLQTKWVDELSGLIIWEELAIQELEVGFSYHYSLDYSRRSIVTTKYVVEALAAAEFCVSLGIVFKPKTQKLFECLKQLLAECGWIAVFENICIVCSRPTKLSLDSEHRLHAEAESAIEFSDGYKIYSYHGVTLPEKYGQIHPNLWQAQWLLAEKNAELRRVLIQGIGYARICSELQATELDCWKEYTLLKIDADIDGFDPDDFDAPKKEDIYLLKMICPSTGHIHVLRVPPDVTSAKEAIRWVNWDIDSEEFSVQT